MQAPRAERADSESDDRVGPGRPPLHTRFPKGVVPGNPGGRSAKSLPVLPADALNETVVVKIDGPRGAPSAINASAQHLAGRFGTNAT